MESATAGAAKDTAGAAKDTLSARPLRDVTQQVRALGPHGDGGGGSTLHLYLYLWDIGAATSPASDGQGERAGPTEREARR